MQKIGIALALALTAGALAQSKDNSKIQDVLSGYNGGVGGMTSRTIQTTNFNVAGILSYDGYGDPLNEVFNVNLGANAHVIGIGWDVTLFADSPSWLSELVVAFENTSQTTGVFLTPGVGDTFSGTDSYSSGGIVDLVGIALDFNVDGDGNLRLEFFEGFDDFANDWDGEWLSGTLTIQYDVIPAPGAAALIAGAGLVALRRRR